MFFKRKVFTPFVALLLCVVFGVGGFLITYLCMRERGPSDLYAAAVTDSVVADEDEIFPLVELTRQSDMTTWDSEGRVLLLSWNRHPEVYVEGREVVLQGELWTFTDREIGNWIRTKGKGVKDWNERLKQLIGLPPTSAYTHVSAFWVDVADVIRPAYQTDVTRQMDASLLGSSPAEHTAWFDGNIVYSYFTSDYPWTRLGYTYDWAEGSGEYGLTEFLVLDGATVEVEYTMATADFITHMQSV